ncbi:MAG: acyl-CoA thioesterase [Deltaproteobacteria bacterium]|nr:MAG: acyl-CoA thioesterase [Deltaproteobacteria bacterium]
MPPPQAKTSTVSHRVPFYETDAMRIVHHSNFVRYLELARILWLDEHERPYRDYMERGLHFATTHVAVDYRRPAGYDDVLAITTWLAWVRGASLRMEYEIVRDGELLVTAATEHALVDADGRVQRIPRDQRRALAHLLPDPAPGA